MLKPEQSEIVIDLIRQYARMRRGRLQLIRRITSLVEAQEAGIPDQFLLPFSSTLQKAINQARFDQSTIPSSVTSLFLKNQRCAIGNQAALEKFRARMQAEFGAAAEDAVLCGDGAPLTALYEDSGAYPARWWGAVLRDGTRADGRKALNPPAEDWSEKVEFGNSSWRRPKLIFLMTLLAEYVGDPTISPDPPMWPHLGLALLVYRDGVSAEKILEMGSRLANRNNVERGLVIAAHIFPELSKWLGSARLDIPMWERKFAIPLVARRLVIGDRD